MATTDETQPNNVPMAPEKQPNQDSGATESQPKQDQVTPETQPNQDPSAPEAQPNQDPSPPEAQPNQDPSPPEAQPNQDPSPPEAQPNQDPSPPEAQPNQDPSPPEAQPNQDPSPPETQPNQDPSPPETQPNQDLSPSETHPNQDPSPPETQPNQDLSTPETLPNQDSASQEMQPNQDSAPQQTQPNQDSVPQEMQPNQDAQPNEEPMTQEMEVQPSHEPMPPETQTKSGDESRPHETQRQPSHEPVPNEMETQLNQEPVLHEMQPQSSQEAMPQGTHPNHEAMPHGTQPSREVMSHETHPSNEPLPHEMQPSNEAMQHEMQANREQFSHEAQPGHEQFSHETQPSNEQMQHETQPTHEQMQHEIQPNHEQMQHETQPNYEPLHDGTLPNHEQMPMETGPKYEPIHLETQAKYEPMHHEAQDKYEQMHHDSQHNYMMMTPEAQHNDVMMTPETHHSDLMMTPGTHHTDVMMTTETQTDNVWMNHEMQSQNMLMAPERQPDNTLAIHEQDNALAIMETQPNEVTSPETQPNKRRKKKSIVWEHFTIETVSAGCRRACCKQCKQTFAYSTGSKVAGTSHLKRHIAKGTCLAVLRNQDNNNQLTPYTPRTGGTDPPKRRYRSPSSPYVPFDQDRCRLEIARMIIMHEYPLHMVEHPGFITFVQNLQPRFDKVSFNTVQGDCVATYLREKHNLLKFIESIPGRVCLTLDMWTSNQTLGYVFITGHFVDSEWKLQKRLLNVVMEPYPDSHTAFGHAVAACLSDWSLEGKVFSLTFNHHLGEAGLENLRPLLCIQNPLVLNGQLLVRNCIARTMSSMAKDVLGAGRDIVKKIRDSVKYVKTSESHEEKFLELKQQLQVPSEKSLSLDDQTKWNTTYQMLVAASELKEVFSCLDTSDPDYEEAPSMEDWKFVETLCTFLKPLYDAANILITTTKPTAITFFHEAWKIQSDLACTVTSEDPFIRSFVTAMHEKIDKYWKDCCLVLAIAVVMDPRFKMKLVEFSFTKLYGEDAPAYIRIVDDGIHELFLEYVSLPLPLTPTYAEEGNNTKTEESPGGGSLLSDNGLTDFDMYIMETSSQQMKSELDQYLEESLLPRVHDFDVLGWWRLNKLKYPTLSKMARDILSISVSTVTNDSVFDTVPREMDSYRSSLRPETVEALICAKDWFQYGSAEASTAPVKMEF